jgi:GNAT superfamily N-acetyltransferase
LSRYRIRRIEAGDSLDELTSMLHRAFGVLGRSGLNCPGVDQSIEATFHRARRGDCFVAIADGRIVGTLTLESPERGSVCHWYRRPDVASLHQFAVDPCHQGLGCGKALLQAAEEWTREHGYRELALDTPSDASHLVAFYRTQGFRVVGEMHRPGRRYRSAILSKTLSSAAPETMPWRSPHRTPWLGTLVRS